MADIKKIARFWFAYLSQDELWVPKDRKPVRIAEMDPAWVRNAVAWQERRAASIETYYTYGELLSLSQPVPVVIGEQDGVPVEVFRAGSNMLPSEGSMAEMAFSDEIERRGKDPVSWLATTPLHKALTARAAEVSGS